MTASVSVFFTFLPNKCVTKRINYTYSTVWIFSMVSPVRYVDLKLSVAIEVLFCFLPLALVITIKILMTLFVDLNIMFKEYKKFKLTKYLLRMLK